jgi:Macrocin-O-methyltransferase (TylF)
MPKDPKRLFRNKCLNIARLTYNFVSTPVAIFFLTYSRRVHSAYSMPWHKRMWLGVRFAYNFSRLTSGTNWRAHLVMAMKLLEIPPEVKGAVVECGCWKGGATVNLSLIAKITGRELKVYDSFEGLPPPTSGDPIAERSFRNGFVPGVYGGSLEEVTENIRRYGALETCSFHKGWFKDTLPHHEGPIVLAFWDVDYCASLDDCLRNLWPSIVNRGMVFLDEYRDLAYCSVFYSEKYWSKYFSCDPPGLIGIGTGVQVGMHYTDPSFGMGNPGIQGGESVAYCRKGDRSIWNYYPDELEEQISDEALSKKAGPSGSRE